jgi:hypothetical protein
MHNQWAGRPCLPSGRAPRVWSTARLTRASPGRSTSVTSGARDAWTSSGAELWRDDRALATAREGEPPAASTLGTLGLYRTQRSPQRRALIGAAGDPRNVPHAAVRRHSGHWPPRSLARHGRPDRSRNARRWIGSPCARDRGARLELASEAGRRRRPQGVASGFGRSSSNAIRAASGSQRSSTMLTSSASPRPRQPSLPPSRGCERVRDDDRNARVGRGPLAPWPTPCALAPQRSALLLLPRCSSAATRAPGVAVATAGRPSR